MSDIKITQAQAKALKKMLGKLSGEKEKELFGFSKDESESMTDLWFSLIELQNESSKKASDIKLHSIDQYKQKAIIEKFNQLIEISYANLHGHVMLIDIIERYEQNGLDPHHVLKLLNDHVADTH